MFRIIRGLVVTCIEDVDAGLVHKEAFKEALD
jgi:hypothetical protein